ncbi:MAG: hypothetical protein L6R42_000790 [Xanthoria sp. 1 TBL-2021]|nr:MAG: hypothetical protein L6R42_000790 [Xanthoria sp. 1 TBL-2021]
MDAEQFRRAGHAAVDEIIDYFTNLGSRRVASNVSSGYLRPLLPSKPLDEGERWADIQKDIEAKIMPGLTHWQSPNFMAFFPANATYPSILGEMYSAAFTAPAFNWLCSPACTELETIVLDWLCNLLHLPAAYLSTSATGGGGVIQGSASEAIVTVMIAAREHFIRRHCRLSVKNKLSQTASEVEAEDEEWRLRTRLVALGSEMSHSSTQKAAMIAGVHYESIPVDVTDEFALTGRGLTEALQDLTRRGWAPFYLTVTLGTTSTCAVDHFKEIAEVKKQFPNVWIHVNAAYAGAALLLEEYHELTNGFEAFDSFDVNMHKWLLTNFDASCLFLPCREPLISALTITPSYLQNNYSSSGLVTDYRDWQIPLGRRFRALKIWFVLRSYGVNGMKDHVKRHIGLGNRFANWVKYEGSDLFELVAPPRFALTVLRVKLPKEKREKTTAPLGTSKAGTTETKVDEGLASNDVFPLPNGADKGPHTDMLTRANAVTKEVYESINASGDIFLTSTMIKDCYAIRVVGANEQTDEQHLRKAFEILAGTTKEILRKLERQAEPE